MRDPWRHVRRSRRRIEGDLNEELSFHLEARTRELERQGYSAAAARSEALRRFGDLAVTRAVCVAADEQHERRLRRRDVLSDLWQDARLGARQLLRRPAFSLLVIATLSLGIGAATAIFSIADHIAFRPLPYAAAEQVLAVWQTDARTGERRQPVAPANWLDWQAGTRSFAAWGLAEPYGFDLTEAVPPEPVRALLVTDGWFDALGVAPARGRGFTADDYASGARVVLLSHEFWQRRFGGDRALVGSTLSIDGEAATVVGVLPPGVAYPERAAIYAPKQFRPDEERDRRSTYMFAIARLAPGATQGAAGAELDALAASLAVEHPETNAAIGTEAVRLAEQVLGPVRPALFTLLGAVALLLLIACANVAGLLLARDADRAREYAVRAALGAGRGRIGRQVLAENLVLAAIVFGAGVALGRVLLGAFVALAPAELPRVEAVTLDARVLGFALLATLATTLLFAIAPALRASRTAAGGALGGRGTTAGARRQRLGRLIVAAEVALALVLLVGAGLLARSFASLLATEVGFATENRATLQLFLFDRNPTPAERIVRMNEMIAALEATPGVRRVGATSGVPFHPTRIDPRSTLHIPGAADLGAGEERRIVTLLASPGYFDAMGIAIVRGRAFTERDRAGAPPVALINETTARLHFAGEDPIGRHVSFGVMSAPQTREIVGIVRDTRAVRRDAEPQPETYVPFAQHGYGGVTFVVETESSATALLPALQRRIAEVDALQSIHHAATVEDLVAATLVERRFHLALLAAFALLALVLAATGLYGVISFTTRRRLPEIGIRLALGARPAEVVRLVVGDGVRVAALGVGAGLVAAALLSRLLAGMLYGVQPLDIATYAPLALLMLAVAVLAAWLPARRAAGHDPLRSLRE